MDSVCLQGPQGRPLCRPKRLAADKAYSQPRIRRWLRAHRIQAVIPQRSDQLRQHRGRPLIFDARAYRRRNQVERCVGRLKDFRRLSTRYEKYADSFQAMFDLARTRIYMKRILSNTP